MNRGLIITGLAFIIGIVLVASVNFMVLGNQDMNQGNALKMKIDAVTNRNSDIKWIINNTVEEGIDQGGDCSGTASIIQNNLNQVFSDSLINKGLTETNVSSVNVDDSNSDFTVSVDYTIETDDGEIHKEVEFQETYTCS